MVQFPPLCAVLVCSNGLEPVLLPGSPGGIVSSWARSPKKTARLVGKEHGVSYRASCRPLCRLSCGRLRVSRVVSYAASSFAPCVASCLLSRVTSCDVCSRRAVSRVMTRDARRGARHMAADVRPDSRRDSRHTIRRMTYDTRVIHINTRHETLDTERLQITRDARYTTQGTRHYARRDSPQHARSDTQRGIRHDA